MATSSASQCQQCGYAHNPDTSDHIFVYSTAKIPHKLLDPLTLLPFVEPVILNICGHIFSRRSLQDSLAVHAACPMDGAAVSPWRTQVSPAPEWLLEQLGALRVRHCSPRITNMHENTNNGMISMSTSAGCMHAHSQITHAKLQIATHTRLIACTRFAPVLRQCA